MKSYSKCTKKKKVQKKTTKTINY